MYAIFRAKGKQFRAEPAATLRLPSLDAEPGDRVRFDEVLLAESDGGVIIGSPSVAGAFVQAEVVGHGRGKKIIVFKMKRRKGYRRKQGHRQNFTEIRIVDIGIDEPEKAKRKAQAPKKAVEAEARTGKPAPADITDVARQLAEKHGIDISTILGSGKGGRILKSDIDKAIQNQGEE